MISQDVLLHLLQCSSYHIQAYNPSWEMFNNHYLIIYQSEFWKTQEILPMTNYQITSLLFCRLSGWFILQNGHFFLTGAQHLSVDLVDVHVLFLDRLPHTISVEHKKRFAHILIILALQELFTEPDVEATVVLRLQLAAFRSNGIHPEI